MCVGGGGGRGGGAGTSSLQHADLRAARSRNPTRPPTRVERAPALQAHDLTRRVQRPAVHRQQPRTVLHWGGGGGVRACVRGCAGTAVAAHAPPCAPCSLVLITSSGCSASAVPSPAVHPATACLLDAQRVWWGRGGAGGHHPRPPCGHCHCFPPHHLHRAAASPLQRLAAVGLAHVACVAIAPARSRHPTPRPHPPISAASGAGIGERRLWGLGGGARVLSAPCHAGQHRASCLPRARVRLAAAHTHTHTGSWQTRHRQPGRQPWPCAPQPPLARSR